MDDEARRAELAVLVRERRGRRSVRSVASASGLDTRTLARLEAGERVRPTQLDSLDGVLGWARGASRAYLAGATAHPASYLPATDADETALLDRLAALTAETAAVVEQLRRLRGPSD